MFRFQIKMHFFDLRKFIKQTNRLLSAVGMLKGFVQELLQTNFNVLNRTTERCVIIIKFLNI